MLSFFENLFIVAITIDKHPHLQQYLKNCLCIHVGSWKSNLLSIHLPPSLGRSTLGQVLPATFSSSTRQRRSPHTTYHPTSSITYCRFFLACPILLIVAPRFCLRTCVSLSLGNTLRFNSGALKTVLHKQFAGNSVTFSCYLYNRAAIVLEKILSERIFWKLKYEQKCQKFQSSEDRYSVNNLNITEHKYVASRHWEEICWILRFCGLVPRHAPKCHNETLKTLHIPMCKAFWQRMHRNVNKRSRPLVTEKQLNR